MILFRVPKEEGRGKKWTVNSRTDIRDFVLQWTDLLNKPLGTLNKNIISINEFMIYEDHVRLIEIRVKHMPLKRMNVTLLMDESQLKESLDYEKNDLTGNCINTFSALMLIVRSQVELEAGTQLLQKMQRPQSRSIPSFYVQTLDKLQQIGLHIFADEEDSDVLHRFNGCWM